MLYNTYCVVSGFLSADFGIYCAVGGKGIFVSSSQSPSPPKNRIYKKKVWKAINSTPIKCCAALYATVNISNYWGERKNKFHKRGGWFFKKNIYIPASTLFEVYIKYPPKENIWIRSDLTQLTCRFNKFPGLGRYID